MAVDNKERRGASSHSPVWMGYVFALALNAAVTAVLLAIHGSFPLGDFPIPYVLITMVVAYFFGGGPAIVAAALGWIVFTWVFVEQPGIWPIATTPGGWARELAYVLGVTVVAIAAIQTKKSQRRIQGLADEATALNVSLS